MPVHFVCPVCGKQFQCDDPHEGPTEKVGVILECPLHKGAIYVFVKDDTGKGVAKVKTECSGQKAVNSDDEGFAFYEQLEAGPYTVGIDLPGSDDLDVKKNHYTFTRVELKTSVEKGKITTVEFQINRYGFLHVEVKRTNDKKLVPAVKIRVSAEKSADNPLQPEETSLDTGPAHFHKLKPTTKYKAAIQLVELHEKKFRIEGPPEQDNIWVTPEGPNKIEFLVAPLYWIKLKVVDGKETVSSTIMLQQMGKDETEAVDLGGARGLEGLDAGPAKVNLVKVPEASYEFVSIKPKG